MCGTAKAATCIHIKDILRFMLNKAKFRTKELKEMVKKKTLNEEVSLYTSVVLLTIIWLARIERERGDRV